MVSNVMSPTPILISERLVRATIAVTHGRVADMRSQAFSFEKVLEEHYLPATVLPIPDTIEGAFPRITFTSKNGHSQISCALNSITLNVQFSPDWQTEHPKAFEYLNQRMALVEHMLAILTEAKPKFSGVILMLNMPSNSEEAALSSHLHRRLRLPDSQSGAFDTEVKTARVVEGRYFQTTVVRNYRTFPPPVEEGNVPPMPATRAAERGVQIVVDFNDRYSFNETPDYISSQATRVALIGKAATALAATYQELRG